jgi:hypothetical protein
MQHLQADSSNRVVVDNCVVVALLKARSNIAARAA